MELSHISAYFDTIPEGVQRLPLTCSHTARMPLIAGSMLAKSESQYQEAAQTSTFFHRDGYAKKPYTLVG